MGYGDLGILGAAEGQETRECFSEIKAACSRAKALVEQILTFARRVEHDVEPIRLRAPVEEAMKLLRASLPATVEIRAELASDAFVIADPTRVHQIVMNLCTNAGLAMRESEGGVLRVSLTDVELDALAASRHQGLKPGPHVKLTVADTGCGISSEELDRVFEPFFTTRPKTGGTGLGLAVVHGIVAEYGGAISVTSELGRGTTVEVYVPVAETQGRSEGPASSDVPTGTERVLVVDDEQIIVRLLERILRYLGYEVATAARLRPRDYRHDHAVDDRRSSRA
jgi:signal transduction histidine kinase